MEDLTGKIFGRLTVIKFNRREIKGTQYTYYWDCLCECGNKKTIPAGQFRNGKTVSCGCFHAEKLKERKKANTYTWREDHIEAQIPDGPTFIFDKDDFDLVSKNHFWSLDNGYAADWARGNGRKRIFLHRLILDVVGSEVVDHINGNKLDNRRSNLRIADKSINSKNRPTQNNSPTGVRGVVRTKNGKRFRASIRQMGIDINLGTFDTLEDAKNARINGEIEYWGQVYTQDFLK